MLIKGLIFSIGSNWHVVYHNFIDKKVRQIEQTLEIKPSQY